MFILYNILLTLLAPIWVPWMLLRARSRREQPNWKERQGEFEIEPISGVRRVWVHAVSVGEVIAATPILRELKGLLPTHEIVLSVTTSSGHQTARERAVGLYDHLVYFPIDVARFQLAAMSRVRPDAVAIMETELWLNFLWAAKAVGAQTLLVNGRISDRSFPRARRIAYFYRRLTAFLDQALMQSKRDAERIEALGAKNVRVLGNCKFDEAADIDADPEAVRADLGIPHGALVIVVGSTRGEEEERFVLDALAALDREGVVIVHAPRHLERAAALAEAASERLGAAARRSAGQTGPYLVLDTYGELGRVYSAADVVIVGGGFANHGGQNLLQPLALGKPVLFGPHMQNFADAAREAQACGAGIVCVTPEELAEAMADLLGDRSRREEMGRAAAEMIARHLGASRRYAEAIAEACGKGNR